MPGKTKANFDIIFAAILFVSLSLLGIFINTTGDSGDSILHFLYSKYSFSHPEFFFHHWAKPLFVLLSSPFSQFGFKGIIVFNCLAVSLTCLFTYRTAKCLHIKHAWFVFVFILFCPLYFKLIFSGLTEYLFGLALILPVYLILKNKYTAAVIIASFSPFIRSEGLLILFVFALFLIGVKKYKLIPLLLTGHIIYSIAGFFYYKDFLWVFTKIPYRNLASPYGSGTILDFFHRLNYVIEKPVYLLLLIGIIALFYDLIRFRAQKFRNVEIFLVYGVFIVIFIAHSLFWWLGIFNSMGLPRVLIPVVPQIALIALTGVNFLTSKLKPSVLKWILPAIIGIIMVFPFTRRSEGVVFNKNLWSLPDNELIEKEVVPYLRQNFQNLNDRLLYYSQGYFSVLLNIDLFDASRHREMSRLSVENAPEGAIVIWDNWFSVVEHHISLEQLKHDKNLKLIREFTLQDNKRFIEFVVFTSTTGKN